MKFGLIEASLAGVMLGWRRPNITFKEENDNLLQRVTAGLSVADRVLCGQEPPSCEVIGLKEPFDNARLAYKGELHRT